MKDHNHDLVQALHHVLDNEWRAKEYKKNAMECVHCQALWEEFDKKNHELATNLKTEIARHAKEDRFD